MSKKNKGQYVIGVDGGATKSIVAVADTNGNIVRVKLGASLNYHSAGKVESKVRLKKLLGNLFIQYSVKTIVFGLAGLNTPKDQRFYNQMVKHIVPGGAKMLVVNDTKIALEFACPGDPARLLVVSGTGSNVYGESRGKKARAGGWDFLLGDEGSGYEFGMMAIRAAIRSYDGRGEQTLLEKLTVHHAGVASIPDLINLVYKIRHERPNELKHYIASFSFLVDRAVGKGDRVARRIVRQGAEELFLGARAVIKKLHMERETLCVGLAGSNFKAPGLKNSLLKKIRSIAPKAYGVYPVTPVEGAVRMAVRALSKKPSSKSEG